MKTQISLLPPKGILAAAEVMTLANTPHKHLDEKWKRMSPTTHVDAALRHLYAWLSGEGCDPELGTSHLANAAVRLLMSCERELDEQERIANTTVPGTISDMARRADGFRKRGDDRINYTHAEETPLPVPSDVKYRIVDTHPRGYVHLMESPLPAPVQPEYEAWLDGKLRANAKIGDVVCRRGGGYVAVVDKITEHFVSGKVIGLGLVVHHQHGSYVVIEDMSENLSPPQTPQQGIDNIKPSQWDEMNKNYLAGDPHGLNRYDNATRNQSKGDEE